MRRFRRFAAAASAVLLLQLVLAGSGVACVAPAIQQAGGANAAAIPMPGMDMPMPAQSAPTDETPSHLPWAPAGCQPMAPCSPAVVVSTPVTFTALTVAAATVDGGEPLAPPSRTTRPELPPPRV